MMGPTSVACIIDPNLKEFQNYIISHKLRENRRSGKEVKEEGEGGSCDRCEDEGLKAKPLG